MAKTHQLKLTPLQRESLLQVVPISSALKQQLQSADAGDQILQLTPQVLEGLLSQLVAAEDSIKGPHKSRLLAVKSKVAQQLQGITGSPAGWGRTIHRPTTAQPSAPPVANKSEFIYQFKITLLYIQPLIWRQIQIPDCTLGDLHNYIQAAFGWEDYHMHQFAIDGQLFGPEELVDADYDSKTLDEDQVMIGQLIPQTKRKIRWLYEYDFGDGWEHEILLEGKFPAVPKVKYPLCAGGVRACPPEDCGGPWGYANMATALFDRKHEQYEEYLEAYGPLNPDAFNTKKTTKVMQKISR